MLLRNNNAVIYSAGGSIGGAAARAFAREGARVFLAGRVLADFDTVLKDIAAAGVISDAASVDALDEQAVDNDINAVVK